MSRIVASTRSHFDVRILFFNAAIEVTTKRKLWFYGVTVVILKSPGCTMMLDNEATESWKWSNTNSINTIAPFCALALADGFLWAEIVSILSCLCIKRCCLILCLSQVSGLFGCRAPADMVSHEQHKRFVMKIVQKSARHSSHATDNYCFLLLMCLLSTICFNG